LYAALGRRRLQASAREQPDDDKAGEGLDETVCTEADQRDRARSKAGAEGNTELDEVPADPAQANKRARRSSRARCAAAADVSRTELLSSIARLIGMRVAAATEPA
jgi:hypothetical protein